ncbi:MAG TPA: glutamine amidotransferase [Firmicutes bacterium]|jgi:lipid II isoglutaminyl synthase (glutamine-hydrolysing)|nr:glutamine amidotransferase [Bacillota bacterium]
MDLKLAYFYPTLMNLYGDRGNVQTLAERCHWRGIDLHITEIEIGSTSSFNEFDLAFFGGGQDKEQFKIGADLITTKANNLKAAIEDGLVMLNVCGGYQLLGEYYRPIQGPILKGLSILDVRTEGGTVRAIGNMIAETELESGQKMLLVGFENHSGRTYLGGRCQSLAKVVKGFGNNGEDQTEGARYLNCFGCYLHGPLLPKNPGFADYLISLALQRKYGKADLTPLEDILENQTRDYVLKRVGKRSLLKGKRS